MTLEEAIFKGVSSAADVGAAWQKEVSDEVELVRWRSTKVPHDVIDDCADWPQNHRRGA
ncbi:MULTISPECIES: hypothetical protein [unclassified Pseudomonas]|uniref:hypothetical protein n=1 Tax=unclassified Pseudomonas TaxID=196821 RepID=UPI0013028C1A|nr:MULTISPECIES: hypothetical protein [unclassified Pseudomonas]